MAIILISKKVFLLSSSSQINLVFFFWIQPFEWMNSFNVGFWCHILEMFFCFCIFFYLFDFVFYFLFFNGEPENWCYFHQWLIFLFFFLLLPYITKKKKMNKINSFVDNIFDFSIDSLDIYNGRMFRVLWLPGFFLSFFFLELRKN